MVEEQMPPAMDVPVVVEDDDEDEVEVLVGKTPEWLDVLLRTNFWEPCTEHAAQNRAEKCIFCINCFNVSCPHCTHDKPGHHLLKIRRYVYRSVVQAQDMERLNVDVSRIQTYVINGRNVVYLRPMNRSKQFRPQAGTPRCLTCDCWLRNAPNLFCSLTCEEKVDVSQDDFSGPEAEFRYRSHQNMLRESAHHVEPLGESSQQGQEHHHVLPKAEDGPQHVLLPEESDDDDEHGDEPPPPPPPPANQHISFRRRMRKQAAPERAPFF
ncbi:hypothetical protein BS78_01G337100 [Paspalum vaginatum]|nr:hypothetical protein BS78_01G337100 [Paspalum vaginatum]